MEFLVAGGAAAAAVWAAGSVTQAARALRRGPARHRLTTFDTDGRA